MHRSNSYVASASPERVRTNSNSGNTIDNDLGNESTNVVSTPPGRKRTKGLAAPTKPAQNVEALTAKEVRVARKAFAAVRREADIRLNAVIRAATSTSPKHAPDKNQQDALKASVKVFDTLAPLVRRRQDVFASVRENCSERLIRGKVLREMTDENLKHLDSCLDKFTFASQAVVIVLLAYATKAELLRRELTAVDMKEAPLTKLDGLHTLAKHLLATAPERKVLPSEQTILGTAYTTQSLQALVDAAADARTTLIEAQETVKKLVQTEKSQPIAQRSIDDIKTLKNALDRVIKVRQIEHGDGNSNVHNVKLLGLQRMLDARVAAEKKGVTRPAPPLVDLVDTTESGSEMDIDWARAGLVQARQKGIEGADLPHMMKLLFQISMVLDETQDIDDLKELQVVADAMKKAGIPHAEIAADVLELSKLLDEKMANIRTA